MMKRSISLILALVLVMSVLIVQPNGAKAADNEATEVLVATKDTEKVFSEWATGKYSYIKLQSDDVWTMNGERLVIDLAGFDLTVSGSGHISAFDTANDAYDASACGVILNNGDVTFAEDVVAPNGNRYITTLDGNKASAHRLNVTLGTVSLRTSATGIYYKAQYDCDSVLAEAVQSYGVIVSVKDMPGADFKNDGYDNNQYTVAKEPFESGKVTTSGSIFGIMKANRSATTNNQRARMPIYANAYVDFGNGPVVADTANVGKTVEDADFTGAGLSLYDVMRKVDAAYANYSTAVRSQLDAFFQKWQDKGMNWAFTNIGSTAGTTDAIDNSDLVFDEGTTNAMCPVCQEKVTWTALTVEETHQNLNGHYYVPEDLTFENNGDAFFFNSTKDSTLCVHLNGHNLTATKSRVLHGSSGRTNIMGNGIVSGYQSSAGEAAAVRVNNTVANQSVHLYGGTYQKTANSNANAAAVGIATAGGHLYIYEGATIEGDGKTAIIVRSNLYKTGTSMSLYGCTVNGDVKLPDIQENYDNAVAVELVDCNISGNLDMYENNKVCLSGAAKIGSVTRHGDVLLNTQALTEGASVGIASEGIFTEASASVKNYLKYFYGTAVATKITVRDNALHCGSDYTSDLVFEEGTTNAACPVCHKVVTWTPVDGSARVDNSTTKLTQHYYLTKDVTYTAESGDKTFISPGHGTHTVCFHLNGHNVTCTNTQFVYGGTSTTNIMGTGIVTGSRTDPTGYGSTAQINVANVSGTVNLYSGTYRQAEGGKYPNDYVISVSANGGNINILENAVVEANSNGKAIYLGNSTRVNSTSKISGTVKGDVFVEESPSQNTGTVTVDGGTVTGTLTVKNGNALTVSGAAKIGVLDLADTVKLTMGKLTKGANITVLNAGVFTEPHAEAEAYAKFFYTANPNDVIAVVDGALSYKINYEAKIYPDAEGKAYCPVCKDTVVWTALTDTSAAQNLNGHYYLTDDLVYENTGDGYIYNDTKNTTLCLHLNGNDITATNTYAIFGSSGYLNVLGRGVVSGYDKDVADGMTIRLNNSVATNGISLYSGTYRGYNPNAGKALISLGTNGGSVKIYEDAKVDAGADGIAIAYSQAAALRKKEFHVYGAEITGDIIMSGVAEGKTVTSTLELHSANIIGEVSATATDTLTISGDTKISKLILAEGTLVTFEDLKDKTDITVSATGYFTPAMDQADQWLKYITCADQGDWIVVRDKAFYQEAKPEIPAASENDQAALLATYEGKTLRYGEMHNHTNTGPYLDDGTGYRPSTGADGQRSLEEWIAEMDRLQMDFAFIVDHGMSIHMYFDKFLPEYFIGGTEPGTTITDSNATSKSPHYNMLFADPEKLESIFFKWEDKFKPIKWNKENYPTAKEPSEDGYRVVYPKFTVAEFTQLAKDVYDAGGLLVQVHPKHEGYLSSDNPLDYYFGDYTGFEIITGNGKAQNMMHTYNNKAYETWVDLLELGKKVWATAGSDSHRLPDISALTAMYTTNDHKDDYMATIRAGNMAPGWVGIRMNVNGTAMGGETDFTGQRLQFSVGDIYNTGVQDKATVPTPAPYVEGHTYCAQLYSESGLLMESVIDPIEMNYFAIDCDATAMFYRVVVWDLTTSCRIGVSNPIWNTAE